MAVQKQSFDNRGICGNCYTGTSQTKKMTQPGKITEQACRHIVDAVVGIFDHAGIFVDRAGGHECEGGGISRRGDGGEGAGRSLGHREGPGSWQTRWKGAQRCTKPTCTWDACLYKNARSTWDGQCLFDRLHGGGLGIIRERPTALFILDPRSTVF